MTNIFRIVPGDDDLRVKSAWKKSQNGEYSVSRLYIAIVQHQNPKLLRGPAVKSFEIPAGADYELQNKRVKVTKFSEEITDEVVRSISDKLGSELTATTSFQIGSGKLLPEIDFKGELKGRISGEFLDETKMGVSAKRAFEITETSELAHTLKFSQGETNNTSSRRLSFYPLLHEWHWDFYLYRFEFMKLAYRNTWLWSQVRKTIESEQVDEILPLCRISIYEPDDELSIKEGEYTPDVDADAVHEVRLQSLSDNCPIAKFKRGESLQDLAKIAFPQTKEEREAADKYTKQKKHVAKKAFRKPVAKKMAKPTARKSAVKKPSLAKTKRRPTRKQ